MAVKTPYSVPANLDILPFPSTRSDPEHLLCSVCLRPLDLHQPSLQAPDMLLGICESCQRWFVILSMAEVTEVVMVRLPDREWLMTAIGQSGSSATPVTPILE